MMHLRIYDASWLCDASWLHVRRIFANQSPNQSHTRCVACTYLGNKAMTSGHALSMRQTVVENGETLGSLPKIFSICEIKWPSVRSVSTKNRFETYDLLNLISTCVAENFECLSMHWCQWWVDLKVCHFLVLIPAIRFQKFGCKNMHRKLRDPKSFMP